MYRLDNVEVSYWLTEWCNEAKLSPSTVQYKIGRDTLYVLTPYVGWLIGKQGLLYEKYKNDLQKREQKYNCENKLEIKLIETTVANFWVDYEWLED